MMYGTHNVVSVQLLKYGLEDKFEFLQEQGIYFFIKRPTQPATELVAGPLSLAVNRLGREAEYSCQFNAKVKI